MTQVKSMIVEALNNLRATPVRFLLVMLTLAACLSAPGFVAARFSANAWTNQDSAVRHGAFVYLVESQDTDLSGGLTGIDGEECEAFGGVQSITAAGVFATVDGAVVDSHPGGGFEVIDASAGVLSIIDPAHAPYGARVGRDAASELGVSDGATMNVDTRPHLVGLLPDIAGRSDYFARSVLLEGLPAQTRGRCLIEKDMKDLDFTDQVVQAAAGERKWRTSKFSEYTPYFADEALAERNGISLVAICLSAALIVIVLLLALRKTVVIAYYLAGANRGFVTGVFLIELYLVAAVTVPCALTATFVGGEMTGRDIRYGLADQALTAALLIATVSLVVFIGIGSPSKVFEMTRRAE